MRAQIRLKPTTATPVPGVEFGVFVDVVDGADSSLLNKKVRAQRRPAGRFECARSRRAAPRAQVALALFKLDDDEIQRGLVGARRAVVCARRSQRVCP